MMRYFLDTALEVQLVFDLVPEDSLTVLSFVTPVDAPSVKSLPSRSPLPGFVLRVSPCSLSSNRLLILDILVDMTFSNSLRGQAEKVFASRKDKSGFVDYEFKVHAGQLTFPASLPSFIGSLFSS